MIPGPLKPTIETPVEAADDGIIHIIAQDGAITLSTTAYKSEEDENAIVKLTYDWKKINEDNTFTPVTGENIIITEDKSKITIQNLPTTGLDERYIAEVTAERNKVKTSASSKIYRITNAPDKPRLICPVRGQRVEADYTTENNIIEYPMRRNGVYQSLSFSVMDNYL